MGTEYHKILSTLLREGEGSPLNLHLPNQTLEFEIKKWFPIISIVDFKFAISDFCDRTIKPRSENTWAHDELARIKLRDAQIRLKRDGYYSFVSNVGTDETILVSMKRGIFSASISQCDAYRILPYRIAALAMFAKKCKMAKLVIHIHDLMVLKSDVGRAKAFLKAPFDRRKARISFTYHGPRLFWHSTDV